MPIMGLYENIPERVLQRSVQRALRNPAIVHTTTCGQRLQVLSPGRVNVHEGPDFLDMAILLGARVIVGAGEFHRRSSDWHAHNHDANSLYSKVVLHIVLEHDSEHDTEHDTSRISKDDVMGNNRPADRAPVLVIQRDDIAPYLRNKSEEPDVELIEEIHAYSLVRLLRLTAEHSHELTTHTVAEVLPWSVLRFLRRYYQKRRRPKVGTPDLQRLAEQVPFSSHERFVCALERGDDVRVQESLQKLLQSSIGGEGEHLRREIVLNCVIPCCLAVARDEARIGIFEWYWSVESLYSYGGLARLFKGCSQKYVWQQQGMLEIAREKAQDLQSHDPSVAYGVAWSCPVITRPKVLTDQQLHGAPSC